MQKPKSEEKLRNIVCKQIEKVGNVTFGKNCIVNPGCSIVAKGGDIIIGDYCVIEEKVCIHNKKVKDKPPKTMKIGSYNHFQIGTIIENSNIGNCNKFGIKSHVLPYCEVKNLCVIGPQVNVPSNSILKDNTMISYPFNTTTENKNQETEIKKQLMAQFSVQAKAISSNNQLQ